MRPNRGWATPVQDSAPTCSEMAGASSSDRRESTVTFSGSPSKAPSSAAAQPVTTTRSALRAARRAALRDLATASAVTQQVLRTRTAA